MLKLKAIFLFEWVFDINYKITGTKQWWKLYNGYNDIENHNDGHDYNDDDIVIMKSKP